MSTAGGVDRYWLTGRAKYRARAIGELASWMDANPPLAGINWASMLELAFRSMSWMWALHFLVECDAADDDSRSPPAPAAPTPPSHIGKDAGCRRLERSGIVGRRGSPQFGDRVGCESADDHERHQGLKPAHGLLSLRLDTPNMVDMQPRGRVHASTEFWSEMIAFTMT